jgi:ribosome-binding factor A
MEIAKFVKLQLVNARLNMLTISKVLVHPPLKEANVRILAYSFPALIAEAV